jgi:hypothetical protein
MSNDFQVIGTNDSALFSLKLHRGDGMLLLAMNWKGGTPPEDFVGFAIEYQEPGGDRFYPLKNRLSFSPATGDVIPNQLSTRLSPIQKFRWVHFPRNAELPGPFTYRVTPVFMDSTDTLSYGEAQEAALELRRDTYPGELNVAFTRGFVSSQAFVDHYGAAAIPKLLPASAKQGLDFVPTYPKAAEALAWMGFEARTAILEVLDQAIADTAAQVRVIAYDLNEPGVVSRLERLQTRLKVIIDDSDDHGQSTSAETKAANRLSASAGAANVKRQHMGNLQHNKIIVVDGPSVQVVACGSTNFSWRAFFVQNNNAMILHGADPVAAFSQAFDNYWSQQPAAFGDTDSANWATLGLTGIDAQVAFSPHAPANALLDSIGNDIGTNTTSSLFYSLAFLYQTTGPILDAIKKVSGDDSIFVYGISDRKVGGLLQGAGGRRRNPHAPQVRRHRLRPADGPCLPGLVQLLVTGRYPERGEPPAHPGSSHRRLLYGRSAAHLRPLPLPRPPARRHEGEAAYPHQASPARGRGTVVARGLHRYPQDPRPRTLRVRRPGLLAGGLLQDRDPCHHQRGDRPGASRPE